MKVGRRPSKERLKDYQHEVKRAKDFRERKGYDDLWDRLRKMYTGEILPQDVTPGEDYIQVNIAFSTINVIYPSVSAGIPQISVTANDPGYEDQAQTVQAVMNFAWTHWDVQRAFRSASKDFLMFGHGWVKVGWRYVEEPRLKTEEELLEEFSTMRQQAIDAGIQTPDIMDQLPSDDEIAANLVTSTATVLEDRPFAESVSILDMFVNPEATSMEDVRWIAQRVVRPLEEVKEDENYKAKTRKNLKGNYTKFETTDPRRDADTMGDGPDMVEMWEFYDLIDGVMAIFPYESDDFLVEPGEMPYHFGHPFVQIRNYEIPDMFYPIGDLEMLYPIQQELNKTRSDMLNFRSAYARKYLARRNAFSPGDEKKLASRKDGEIIWVDDDNIPLGDIVQPMPINSLDSNLFNWSSQILSDMQEVSGVSEYARGTATGAARTATEASLIQDALNARSSEKLSLVEGMATDVAKNLLKIMQQFITGEKVARIVGKQGIEDWLTYDRESIQGEYDFTVEAGSTQPNNETFRRQKAIAMANTLGPFVQLGVIDPVELAKHLLQEGFGIRLPEKFILPPMPPAPVDPMTGEPLPPGEAPMNGAVGAPGGVGMDAPQMDPMALREAQEEAPEGGIDGIPPQLMAQLAGQMGLGSAP